MATDLHTAYEHCQRVAKENAKNFYYAFRTLPAEKRKAIYAAYAFCRACDDIADEDYTMDEKRHLFQSIRQLLTESQDSSTDDPVFTALMDAASTFNIPHGYFSEIIEGVEMDLTANRFPTFDDLWAYCYKVASVVGLICIEVFGYDDPKTQEHAVDLGIAMQLTNILRDIREDAGRGRIYLPLEDLERFGYTEQELMSSVVSEPFRNLMEFQVQRARQYFASGRRLIPLVHTEARACPAVLHQVYSSVLDRIEASDYNVFQQRIGLSKHEKLLIMAKLWASSRASTWPLLGRRFNLS